MNKVIIGIHGLGNKPPRDLLRNWWEAAMLEGFDRNGIKKNLPAFEMVYWADILYDKPLDSSLKKEDNPYYLNEPYLKAPKSNVVKDHLFRKKVTSLISSLLKKIFLNDDKSLNYSFIADAILKKYFRDLDIYYIDECMTENDDMCKTKELIRNRVAETIKRYQDFEIMVIAHSMGSIITYDVLTYLIPEVKIHTFLTIGSPLGLPIAVSKIATEHRQRFNGKNIITTPPGITTNWYNLADILDHVALNNKLADDFKVNDAGIFPIDYLVFNDYESGGNKNPHKSYGYLRTSAVSKILSEFIGEKKLNVAQKVLGKIRQIVGKVKEKSVIL